MKNSFGAGPRFPGIFLIFSAPAEQVKTRLVWKASQLFVIRTYEWNGPINRLIDFEYSREFSIRKKNQTRNFEIITYRRIIFSKNQNKRWFYGAFFLRNQGTVYLEKLEKLYYLLLLNKEIQSVKIQNCICILFSILPLWISRLWEDKKEYRNFKNISIILCPIFNTLTYIVS